MHEGQSFSCRCSTGIADSTSARVQLNLQQSFSWILIVLTLFISMQAGRPKTISGFQTHTTPVLLSVGERAELATQKYIAVNPVLEGIVILQENPEYIDTQE